MVQLSTLLWLVHKSWEGHQPYIRQVHLCLTQFLYTCSEGLWDVLHQPACVLVAQGRCALGEYGSSKLPCVWACCTSYYMLWL